MNHNRPSLELDEVQWNWISIRGGMHSQGTGSSGNGEGRLDSLPRNTIRLTSVAKRDRLDGIALGSFTLLKLNGCSPEVKLSRLLKL